MDEYITLSIKISREYMTQENVDLILQQIIISTIQVILKTTEYIKQIEKIIKEIVADDTINIYDFPNFIKLFLASSQMIFQNSKIVKNLTPITLKYISFSILMYIINSTKSEIFSNIDTRDLYNHYSSLWDLAMFNVSLIENAKNCCC
jgi:hypothetical protein